MLEASNSSLSRNLSTEDVGSSLVVQNGHTVDGSANDGTDGGDGNVGLEGEDL